MKRNKAEKEVKKEVEREGERDFMCSIPIGTSRADGFRVSEDKMDGRERVSILKDVKKAGQEIGGKGERRRERG